MGQDKETKEITILRRLLRYSDKTYQLSSLMESVRDNRLKPQIKTSVVVRSALIMTLTRMGSLNALEQTSKFSFWGRWIEGNLPSADTMGNVFAELICDDLRLNIRHLYTHLKRNKALKPVLSNGLFALIVDGHESSCSYRQSCPGCLQRVIHTTEGDRIQYYHRNVTAILLCKDFPLLLDIEAQKPGEDEVAAATRLVERVIKNYPRAFDLILADGLYTRAPFFKMARDHRKHAIAVLKDERRDLLQDAMSLFETIEPILRDTKQTRSKRWDIEHFTTWTQLEEEVRVVRSLETTTIRRQKDGKEELKISDWVWVSTLPQLQASTEAVVEFGHDRWVIENKCFNELVNTWKVDHVYKHDPVAILAFWLMTMLAYNLVHAFIYYNLKPQLREKHTKLHWAQTITAEIYYISPAPP